MTNEHSNSGNGPVANELIETGALSDSVKQAAIEAIVRGHAPGVAGAFDAYVSGRNSHAASDAANARGEAFQTTMTVDEVGNVSDEALFVLAQETARTDTGGTDFNAAHARAKERFEALTQKLTAHTFNPKTGEKVYDAQGAARQTLELQAKGAYQEFRLSYFQAREVEKARAEKQSRIDAQLREQAAVLAFTGNDPARKAALADAMNRLDAEQFARMILELRTR